MGKQKNRLTATKPQNHFARIPPNRPRSQIEPPLHQGPYPIAHYSLPYTNVPTLYSLPYTASREPMKRARIRPSRANLPYITCAVG
jgi:hypothetical protein